MKPFPYGGPTDLPSVLRYIRERAQGIDRSGDWPAQELQALLAAGAMRWAAPKEVGGDDLPALDLHRRYEELARASLTVALILTQRDSAVGLVDGAEGAAKRSQMLGRFAKGSHFTTVGIAQLTTSRQGGTPALRAEKVAEGWKLNGMIPWCTGAGMADFIVAGAALEDGRQVLFLLEGQAGGVTIEPVMQLVSLRGSFTSSITLKDVLLGEQWLLRGPVEKALVRRNKSLELGQTFLATGLCLSALDLIGEHRSEAAREAGGRFSEQLEKLRGEIGTLSEPGNEKAATEASPRVRGACNELAVRITHAGVTLYKGTGLLLDHPAQRLAREAMFLLVWSCPNPVIDCTVDLLSR